MSGRDERQRRRTLMSGHDRKSGLNGMWPDDDSSHVRLRLSINDINGINLQEHQFSCNLFLEASWTDNDPRVKELLGCKESVHPMPDEWEASPYNAKQTDKLWTPRLSFRNLVKNENNEQVGRLPRAEVDPDPYKY